MSPESLPGVCPRCGATIDDLSRPCPSCGAVISSQSQMPTVASPEDGRSPALHSGPIGRLDSSRGGSAIAFTPGEVIAKRYRIIGLLGRGGMGEVYRADDLELGQAVSLKFLPPSIAATPEALERFRAEVRNARQVSHPNVCRVYDIGEVRGLHFLTMEFVDGEDLATLLRRIGRLPATKADEVASQLCAGLAAAHDKGVLHRDLKPSNVMIDGEGHVRITDFGLAVRAGEGTGEMAGTPAYMAPEQFEGAPVTTRSDLYSLGLILYEIYTGRRPFEAHSLAEWKSRHTESAPPRPSSRDLELDEAVERAILRCLEKDPTKRPASARQLAVALPGGDPVAAALAAGETPSPEMIAASGGEGTLAPRAAWSLAAGIVAAVVGILAISPYSQDLGLARLTMSSDVLRDRASLILDRFGYGHDVVDQGGGFARLYDPMLYIARHVPSTEWRRNWRLGPPVLFLYRQSPRWMTGEPATGRIDGRTPPFELSDMTEIAVDGQGRLRQMRAVPAQVDSAGASAPFRWGALFEAAGIDSSRFQEARPVWVPPSAYDQRAEWTGTVPEAPGIPLRIAAAAQAGRPVYFDIFGPWSKPTRMVRDTPSLGRRIADGTVGFLSLLSLIGAVLLTQRNRRLGRGDLGGATKLGLVVLVTGLIAWVLGAHHVPSIAIEVPAFMSGGAFALAIAMTSTVLYLAIEPYVRRRMPELMIGWARLLEGRFTDPRVGRDVIVGALFGALSAALVHLVNAVPSWIPILGQTPVPPDPQMLESVPAALGSFVGRDLYAVQAALMIFFVLFVLRTVLRRGAPSLVVLMILFGILNLGGENVALETPFAVVQGILLGWTFGRFGLLAGVAMFVFRNALAALPLPISATTPYTLSTLVVLAVLAAITGFALKTSIGSRPLFSGAALDA